MKALSCNFNMVTILLFSILFGLSCSNDADLLADAVLSDVEATERIVADDYFVIQPNESIVLDVLANDDFSSDDQVRIIEISSPIYGSVVISEDNLSITYTPQSEEVEPETEDETEIEVESQEEETQEEETQSEEEVTTPDEEEAAPDEEETQNEEETPTENEPPIEENTETTDTFTYTTEVVNEDETINTEEGTVEVVIDSSVANEDPTEEEDNNTTEEEEEDDTSSDTDSQSANLLFSSGFEGVTLSSQNNDYRYIEGTDSNTGFSWPPAVWGSNSGAERNGIHLIDDGGGGAITNAIQNVIGPNGNSTKTFYTRVNYDPSGGPRSQSPYQINNIQNDPSELYITYWMKLDNTSLKTNDSWRAIWQYKSDNYDYQSPRPGFRVTAFIARDIKGKMYWKFQGDDSPSNPTWEYEVYEDTLPIPREKWFKVEYYIKLSHTNSGRSWMKVNGTLIGDHKGPNLGSAEDTMSFMMLTQVYGNSYPMHQWVDDIEIWDSVPN